MIQPLFFALSAVTPQLLFVNNHDHGAHKIPFYSINGTDATKLVYINMLRAWGCTYVHCFWCICINVLPGFAAIGFLLFHVNPCQPMPTLAATHTIITVLFEASFLFPSLRLPRAPILHLSETVNPCFHQSIYPSIYLSINPLIAGSAGGVAGTTSTRERGRWRRRVLGRSETAADTTVSRLVQRAAPGVRVVGGVFAGGGLRSGCAKVRCVLNVYHCGPYTSIT